MARLRGHREHRCYVDPTNNGRMQIHCVVHSRKKSSSYLDVSLIAQVFQLCCFAPSILLSLKALNRWNPLLCSMQCPGTFGCGLWVGTIWRKHEKITFRSLLLHLLRAPQIQGRRCRKAGKEGGKKKRRRGSACDSSAQNWLIVGDGDPLHQIQRNSSLGSSSHATAEISKNV